MRKNPSLSGGMTCSGSSFIPDLKKIYRFIQKSRHVRYWDTDVMTP